MKSFKSFAKASFVLSAVLILSSCGGANSPNNPSLNPYGYNSNTGNNPGTQTGGYTSQIPGGTRTLIPVLGSYAMMSGTRTLSQTAQVNAGDQIIVNVYGGYVQSYCQNGWFGSNSSGYLSGLTVQLNGQTLGSSSYAQYTAPQAGTLSFAISTITQLCGSSSATYQVNLGQGVYIARCTSTSGASMTCPTTYY